MASVYMPVGEFEHQPFGPRSDRFASACARAGSTIVRLSGTTSRTERARPCRRSVDGRTNVLRVAAPKCRRRSSSTVEEPPPESRRLAARPPCATNPELVLVADAPGAIRKPCGADCSAARLGTPAGRARRQRGRRAQRTYPVLRMTTDLQRPWLERQAPTHPLVAELADSKALIAVEGPTALGNRLRCLQDVLRWTRLGSGGRHDVA